MKVVKFYWELKMTDKVFESESIQKLINEVKSGHFQREVEAGNFDTGGKINKVKATVTIE